jgi:hypothetical protein
LAAKTSVAVDATAVGAITGSTPVLNTLYALSASEITSLSDKNLTVTGTPAAADVNAVAVLTSGTVTATMASGSAADLNAALTETASNAYTLNITGTSANVSDLNALNAKTSVNINVASLTDLTGTSAGLTTLLGGGLLTAASGFSNFDGDETITITDPIGVTTANTLSAVTTGAVTARIIEGDMTTLAGLQDIGNAYSITITDGTVAAAALNTLDTKTMVAIDARAVSIVTAAVVTDLTTAFGSSGINGLAGKDITIPYALGPTGPTGTIISAVDANTAAGLTTGVVTATVMAGAASSLNSALGNATPTDNLTLTVNDFGTVAASDLLALDGKTAVAVNASASSITGVSGSYANLLSAYSSAGITGLGNETITISVAPPFFPRQIAKTKISCLLYGFCIRFAFSSH